MELILSHLFITVRRNDFPEHLYKICVKENDTFLKSYGLQHFMADILYLAALTLDCELVCMVNLAKKVY